LIPGPQACGASASRYKPAKVFKSLALSKRQTLLDDRISMVWRVLYAYNRLQPLELELGCRVLTSWSALGRRRVLGRRRNGNCTSAY
jgi:hypothetical protein